jgi:exosortase E/protease (VPEID-CTERM system)
LVLIGEAGARQIAGGGFHSQAGWIAFNSVALAIAIAARRLPWFSTNGPAVSQPSTDAVENPTAAYLLPFLAVLAAGMISRAASGGFEWLYGLRFIAAAGALWYLRRSYAHLDWNFDWLAVATGVLVALLWIVPDVLFHAHKGEMPAALATAPSLLRTSWIVLRVLAAVVTVPLSEELAFRGFLLRRLVSADFESVPFRGVHWVALGLSSGVFGLLHGGRWLTGIVAGVLFGLVQARRGRIGDAVVAHGVSNTLLAAGVLLSGQWQYW